MLKNKNSRTDLLTYGLVILAFVVMQGMNSADMLGSSVKGFLIPICAYISLAVSLNLLVGVCGELSLGHAGFMGIGAFTGIVIAALLKDVVASDVLRLACAMIGGGVIAGIASFIIGIPVLRLRGDYLAIVTLAFGEILKNLIGNLYIGKDVDGVHFAFDSTKLVLGEGGKKILAGPMGATGVQKIASFPMGFVLVLITLFVGYQYLEMKGLEGIRAEVYQLILKAEHMYEASGTGKQKLK
ncbi:MAG: branched-chain amino acid ABC transporter permease, partial [Clostridia bacterium]|nr:branched-chain amino acid ABC transporter permease [Clostridia bacterium]